MIPAYRKLDNEDTTKNEESFKKARDVLGDNGALLIFPEGTSVEGRTLLPIKSGVARIAIQSGVKIQQVSITYLEPQEFRSYVTMGYQEPISVTEYGEDVKGINFRDRSSIKAG
jgi:1-acyl-sn-glycerol-3-phosphate acyltransferase